MYVKRVFFLRTQILFRYSRNQLVYKVIYTKGDSTVGPNAKMNYPILETDSIAPNRNLTMKRGDPSNMVSGKGGENCARDPAITAPCLLEFGAYDHYTYRSP